MQALQSAVGNRAVARMLTTGTAHPANRSLQRQTAQAQQISPPTGQAQATAGSIAVHPGSKLTAAKLAALLTHSKKLPKWLKSQIGAKANRLVLASDVTIPAGESHMDFVASFNEAFKKANPVGPPRPLERRDWTITTGGATIEVTEDAGQQRWAQRVVADLGRGERLGNFSGGMFLRNDLGSNDKEVQYGQTLETQTNKNPTNTNLMVIITRITVTAPAKGGKGTRTKTFVVDDETITESVVHEIAVHAGEMAQGRPGEHKGAWIAGLTQEVGGLFRPVDSSGDLRPSSLTKRIFAYIGPPSPPAPPLTTPAVAKPAYDDTEMPPYEPHWSSRLDAR